MSSALKHALLDYPNPAYRVAVQMGISEVRLSKIANGLIKPREEEKEALSEILGKPINTLFPSCQCGQGDCGGSCQCHEVKQ